jgi:predicted Zn finger-like uncharacterized protein
MNAQCSSCKTVFRVDPAKVPAGGVRARCSICRSVFEILPPPSAGGAASASPSPEARTPAPAASAPPSVQQAPARAPEPPRPAAAPTPAPASPSTPQPPPPPAPAPSPAPAPAAGGARPSPFGSTDPTAKARRLARALISDIVMYHPDRRDRALAAGTLKTEFLDEIKKSWEEYVGQVGAQTAKSTPFFREALNEILAKGQAVF